MCRFWGKVVVPLLPTRGDGLLTTAQAGQMVGVDPSTIRTWKQRGWLAPQGLDERNRPLYARQAVRAAERRVRENGLRTSGIDPRALRRRTAA
jgi:DNA-binding transcriptional MerR regulator